MNSGASKKAPELPKQSLPVSFFVGKLIPFVHKYNSAFIPSVCLKIPNSHTQTVTRRVNGYTLVELVVTMAVAAILIAIAAPNVRTFIQNGRINTQINDLIGDLNFAKSEAVHRLGQVNVGICRSTDGASFAGVVPLGDGRVVFVDANRNNNCDPGEQILRFREPLASGNTLVLAPANPIIFTASGGPVAPVSFFICDSRGAAYGRQINLNNLGQVTVSTPPPGACT